MGQTESNVDDEATDHLQDVDDSYGCVEIWEWLSERRATAGATDREDSPDR